MYSSSNQQATLLFSNYCLTLLRYTEKTGNYIWSLNKGMYAYKQYFILFYYFYLHKVFVCAYLLDILLKDTQL